MNRLFAVLFLVGCTPPPASEGETAQALGFANDQAAYDFFVQKGLANFQSAGIVGNLDQESGVNPASVQYGGGPGRGIAQWSVGGRWDSSSNDNVLWYAGQKGTSSGSLDLQLEFIWYELTTLGYGFAQLKATTNVTDATVVFMDKYEICGTCDQTTRVSYAKSVLASFGATPDWSASFVSQSWPYASAPAVKLKCGDQLAAKIVLKNSGAKSWDGSTRLGTTTPRDRASIFAGADWLAPNRAAAISGTVAPGADGTFAFSFYGPTGSDCKPGTYSEYFGVVQEGVAWFSDSGQGGPPDNQIEALIDLEPGDPAPVDLGPKTTPTTPTTTVSDDLGPSSAVGDLAPAAGGDDGGAAPPSPDSDPGATPKSAVNGGCRVAGGAAGDADLAILCACIALVAVIRRRRSDARRTLPGT